MDRGTFLGFLLGISLLVVTISLGPDKRPVLDYFIRFLHWESLMVVVGGLAASTLIRFPLTAVGQAFAVASRAFFKHTALPQAVVWQLVGLSQRARKEGLKGLERNMPDDAFLAQGIQMAVDQVERHMIREVLTAEIQSTHDRHSQGQDIFRFIATSAPSWGMVGTLIGMVKMFGDLQATGTSGGMDGLGNAMALSLLSTLWGAIIAYLVAIPIAGKLEHRSREEAQIKQLMMEGIMGIAEEAHPGQLEERLNAFLAPRFKVRRHNTGGRG